MLAPKLEEFKAKQAAAGSRSQWENTMGIGKFYWDNNTFPMASIVPSLIQIPLFIGLYRAVSEMAQSNELNEPFLWLPSLQGPVLDGKLLKASDWLFNGWNNGVPPLGWHDTLAYCTLPLMIVVIQAISMEIITPAKDKQKQGMVGRLLSPMMMGWFSLSVPPALGLYWLTNTVATTFLSYRLQTEPEALEHAELLSKMPKSKSNPDPWAYPGDNSENLWDMSDLQLHRSPPTTDESSLTSSSSSPSSSSFYQDAEIRNDNRESTVR